MTQTINVNKTVTLSQDVFMHLVSVKEKQDVSFSRALNDLCRDGIAARKAETENVSFSRALNDAAIGRMPKRAGCGGGT